MPRRLLALLILTLSLRLCWAFIQPATDAAIDALPDQREYLSLGRNLLHLHRLQFDDRRFGQTIYAYRLPGYPLFVAACGGSIRVVRIVQSFIDVSTVLAAYGIARRVGLSKSVAQIAGALVAVNPFVIYFSGTILTETLFTAAVAWGVRSASSRPSWKSRGGFGISTMVGVLLRPTSVLIFPLIAFAVEGSIKVRIQRAVLTVGIVVFTLTPWALRNQEKLGHRIFSTTNDGVTLYDGFNPTATGASDQRFFDRMPAEKSMSEYDRSESLGRQAKEWVIHNPLAAVSLAVSKVLRGWSPVPLSQDFGKPVYRIVAAGYAVPFDLAVVGGLLFGRLNRSSKWLLVLPAIGVTVAQAVSVGSLRYRIPAEAPLAVIAAAGAGVKMTNDQDPKPNQ